MTERSFIIGTLIAFLAVATVVGAGEETFRATLTGDREVPPVVTQTTGKLTIKFNEQETEGEYTLRVNDGVRVTQAHFHCAPRGVNGPIIIFGRWHFWLFVVGFNVTFLPMHLAGMLPEPSQLPVDFIEIERVRIKPPTGPSKHSVV